MPRSFWKRGVSRKRRWRSELGRTGVRRWRALPARREAWGMVPHRRRASGAGKQQQLLRKWERQR
jgi:hypothetical protein